MVLSLSVLFGKNGWGGMLIKPLITSLEDFNFNELP